LKKAVSIFLVLLLLFNGLGFYGLLQGLRYRSARNLVARLDKDQYSRDETVTIKIPFAIPYQLKSNEYERVDGEIKYEGEFFRLVEQKLEGDTLFIVCIRDHATSRIEEAITDHVKTFTDNPVNSKNTSKTFASFFKDFLPTSTGITHVSDGWSYSVSTQSPPEHFYNRSLAVFTPPPKI
jgi:hypothetical protein